MQGLESWNQFLKTSNYPKTCHTNFPGAQNVSFSTLNSLCEVAQSCPTLCDPMDCKLPASSVRGIFQARVLEWVAISFSRGSSQPRDQTQVSCIAGRCFTIWATREAPNHMREGKRGWVPRQQSTWMQAIWVSHLGIFSFILHWNIVDLHYCVSFRSCEGAILDIAAQLTSQRAE